MRQARFIRITSKQFDHLQRHQCRYVHIACSILSLDSEAVAGADRVVVAASVLAEVGIIRLAPFLSVKRAVGSVGDVVFTQKVGVEEDALVVGAVRAGVAAVIGSVGRAGSGALAGVVETGEVLDAHIGVLAGSVERSVDCATKASWAVVAGAG